MSRTNPFSVNMLASGPGFTDRETEVARIVRAFEEPGAKLVVYGERRLGKSSALAASAERMQGKPIPVVIVDWSTASGPEEAANRILSAVHQRMGRSWKEWVEGVLHRLQVGLTMVPDVSTGLPSVKLSVAPAAATQQTPTLITEVLNAVEAEVTRRKTTLGLVIDEFQRLHEWGGEDAEWALKGTIERHRRVSYVLAGSARSLIEGMVSSRHRALWKVVDTLAFGPIAPHTLARWIGMRAKSTGVDIPPQSARRIIELAGPRTRDVVYLAREVWNVHHVRPTRRGAGSAQVTPALVDEQFARVVSDQAPLHSKMWATLTPRAQHVLRALAAVPSAQLGAEDIRQRFGLGAKSSVYQTVQHLVANEVLVSSGSGSYTFDDPFFLRWVQVHTLEDVGLPVPELRVSAAFSPAARDQSAL